MLAVASRAAGDVLAPVGEPPPVRFGREFPSRRPAASAHSVGGGPGGGTHSPAPCPASAGTRGGGRDGGFMRDSACRSVTGQLTQLLGFVSFSDSLGVEYEVVCGPTVALPQNVTGPSSLASPPRCLLPSGHGPRTPSTRHTPSLSLASCPFPALCGAETTCTWCVRVFRVQLPERARGRPRPARRAAG